MTEKRIHVIDRTGQPPAPQPARPSVSDVLTGPTQAKRPPAAPCPASARKLTTRQAREINLALADFNKALRTHDTMRAVDVRAVMTALFGVGLPYRDAVRLLNVSLDAWSFPLRVNSRLRDWPAWADVEERHDRMLAACESADLECRETTPTLQQNAANFSGVAGSVESPM